MKRVAIIGLGLMGGSLGLAIKSRRLPWHVAGWTRSLQRGKIAKRRGAVDTLAGSPVEAVAGADLVVLCAPVLRLAALASECRPAIESGVVVTDVGSTKAYVDAEIRKALAGTGAVYVGSHPVCGSEQQGIEAAKANLYEKATVIVTPVKDAPAVAVKRVRELWRRVGGRVVEMDAREHDRIVARTSHLPHMVASLLAVTVGRSPDKRIGEFCGTGFADTSRVAEGAPEIWHDIVRTNRANIAEELRAYKSQVERMISQMDDGDFDGITAMLEQGRAARRALLS